jgi:hypothetical protein
VGAQVLALAGCHLHIARLISADVESALRGGLAQCSCCCGQIGRQLLNRRHEERLRPELMLRRLFSRHSHCVVCHRDSYVGILLLRPTPAELAERLLVDPLVPGFLRGLQGPKSLPAEGVPPISREY